jgi:hypothetical protein
MAALTRSSKLLQYINYREAAHTPACIGYY